jgi:hypothetical protein
MCWSTGKDCRVMVACAPEFSPAVRPPRATSRLFTSGSQVINAVFKASESDTRIRTLH